MEYNTSQLNVINSQEPNIIIIAPAGSGKTSTIVGSVEKYKKDNPADKVTVVTFTKKATAELSNRIRLLDVDISTIHSWSYSKLRILADKYAFKIQLLEDDAIKDILKVLCKRRNQFYLNQFQLFNYVMGNYNIDIDSRIKRIFEIIRLDYNKFKREKNLYDFTDLPLYLYDVMTEYGEIITDIDALFVDEFQDVDPIQLKIFNLVKNTKKKMYIGDPKQSIYIFRGAVEEVFDDLEDFVTYNLDTNYRSYQRIIDFATTCRNIGLSRINSEQIYMILEDDIFILPSNIKCERGDGGNIYLIPTIGECKELFPDNSEKEKNESIVLKSLFVEKNTQVLCRSNKQVKKLQSLGINNVSTIHQAKGLEYDNVILVDFPIDCMEELNVSYVAITRAKNKICIVDFDTLLYTIINEQISQDDKLF